MTDLSRPSRPTASNSSSFLIESLLEPTQEEPLALIHRPSPDQNEASSSDAHLSEEEDNDGKVKLEDEEEEEEEEDDDLDEDMEEASEGENEASGNGLVTSSPGLMTSSDHSSHLHRLVSDILDRSRNGVIEKDSSSSPCITPTAPPLPVHSMPPSIPPSLDYLFRLNLQNAVQANFMAIQRMGALGLNNPAVAALLHAQAARSHPPTLVPPPPHPASHGRSSSTRLPIPAACRVPRGEATGSTSRGNAKKYRCDICDKTFSRSNTLITHKRIHTGEKPFKCEHCGRAFRQPGNLTRHRLTHTTVKPYVCAHCDKAFNRASNLHTHMRTHIGV